MRTKFSMNKISFLIGIFVLASFSVSAQKVTGKKAIKLADELMAKGSYNQAAEYYKNAYLDKKSDVLAYKAGECYLLVRDYENAAHFFEKIQETKEKGLEMANFKYGMALKQLGKYVDASKAFKNFGLYYNGIDRPIYEKITKIEMAGCDYAIENTKITKVEFNPLSGKINSEFTEFAPIIIPGTRRELWFSTTTGGSAKIMKSEELNGNWSIPQTPAMFTAAKIEKPHFGNGSFSPNQKRFYFTQCDFNEKGESVCQIYMMEKEESGNWKSPIKLPDYINVPGKTSTHPFVTYMGDKEMLFFSSNKDGGKGGMDLWYCSKSITTGGVNFLNPINLGSNINTDRDEITPFFDTKSEKLFFSSNGLVSLGGFDVFESKQGSSAASWERAKNLGAGVNSSCDDIYYVLNEWGNGGYIVSNRLYGTKTTTVDDDIHFFGMSNPSMNLVGKISDAAGNPVANAPVRIFDVKSSSDQPLKETITDVNGGYVLPVLPNGEYRVEVVSESHSAASFVVETGDFEENASLSQNVKLEKLSVAEMAAKPFKVDQEPPINPNTGEPFDEDSPEFNEWLQLAEVSTRSPVGMVVRDESGSIRPYNPQEASIAMQSKPVVKTNPFDSPPAEAKVAEKNAEPLKPVEKLEKEATLPFASTKTPEKSTQAAVPITKTQPTKPVEKPDVVEAQPVETIEAKPVETPASQPEEAIITKVDEAIEPTPSRDSKATAKLQPKATVPPPAKSQPKVEVPVVDEVASIPTKASVAIPSLRDLAPKDVSEDEVREGFTYKIQLAAVSKIRKEAYEKAQKYIALSYEKTPNGDLTRVVTEDFKTIKEAREYLAILNKVGYLKAFISMYENNERVGMGFH